MSKINNLMTALAGLGGIPGFMERINLPEVAKEVFGQLGFKDGEKLGHALKKLENYWVLNDFILDPQNIKKILN